MVVVSYRFCTSSQFHFLDKILKELIEFKIIENINSSHFILQRVLEHCHDPETQRIVMDEIFQCVCMLAQDQYGNYVVQVHDLSWHLLMLLWLLT